MKEFLNFHKMVTPIFIKFIFWVAMIGVIIGGVAMMMENLIGGLLTIIFGPLLVRIYAELLLVLFQIHTTLVDIKKLLGGSSPSPVHATPTPTTHQQPTA